MKFQYKRKLQNSIRRIFATILLNKQGNKSLNLTRLVHRMAGSNDDSSTVLPGLTVNAHYALSSPSLVRFFVASVSSSFLSRSCCFTPFLSEISIGATTFSTIRFIIIESIHMLKIIAYIKHM